MTKDIRKGVLLWVYPKDEYTENGHWTPHLCVREARRMVAPMWLPVTTSKPTGPKRIPLVWVPGAPTVTWCSASPGPEWCATKATRMTSPPVTIPGRFPTGPSLQNRRNAKISWSRSVYPLLTWTSLPCAWSQSL